MVDESRENRETIEQAVAEIINDVFTQGTQVHMHWSLEHADEQHTGMYVSAFIHTASVTRTEREALADNGLHLVEQAAHVTKNPDMDDTIVEVPIEKLSDAAETDMELVLELDGSFLSEVGL